MKSATYLCPLYEELLSVLRNAPTSSDWFPFPTNFFLREEIYPLTPVYQLYAIRILSVCVQKKCGRLSVDERQLGEFIHANPRIFSANPLISSGFLVRARAERKKERKKERKDGLERAERSAARRKETDSQSRSTRVAFKPATPAEISEIASEFRLKRKRAPHSS